MATKSGTTQPGRAGNGADNNPPDDSDAAPGDRARQAQHHWGGPGTPTFLDPWAEPPPPEWPPDVLPVELHDMLFEISLRDGLDPGAQGMTLLTAASGAAPKNARFYPYGRVRGWAVPPIIWTLIVALSGQRKTALIHNGFEALQRKQAALWRPYLDAMKAWRALPPKARQGAAKPEEPHSYIVTDTTPEKLQMILANTDRGTLLLRDELIGMFEFGRYGRSGGAAERAFYLEAYEAGSFAVHRVSRDSLYIPVNGLTIYGHTQPDRLGEFVGLESDGLLQRFAIIRAAKASAGRAFDTPAASERYDETITRLASLRGRDYRTVEEGSGIIREMERDGIEYATITDYGIGFQGFCGKLHGTLARLALILELFTDPDSPIVQPDTIIRADCLVRQFLLPHARDFYGALSPNLERTRDIAAWLLTTAPARIRASDFAANVRACRKLSLSKLNEALDPLVTGGWLEPKIPFPSNREWKLNVKVRTVLAQRAAAAAHRREEMRQLWQQIAARARAKFDA